jgi:hypothetical protein
VDVVASRYQALAGRRVDATIEAIDRGVIVALMLGCGGGDGNDGGEGWRERLCDGSVEATLERADHPGREREASAMRT